MYLNLVQIAESFGVSEKVVEGWIHNEGMPFTPDRGRLLFDRAQVTQWAAARGLAAQAGFLSANAPVFATGCQLELLLRSGGIWRGVAAADVSGVIESVVTRLPSVTPPVRQLLVQRLRVRGGITWAPIGGGFALPHPSARIALGRDAGTVALIFLREPLPLPEAPADGVDVTRMLFFIAPSPRAHLDLLGRLSRALVSGSFREMVMREASDEEILEAAAAGDAASANQRGPEVSP